MPPIVFLKNILVNLVQKCTKICIKIQLKKSGARVDKFVEVLQQIWVRVSNARRRRHRRVARSPIEDMAFCAPRRVAICVASLQEMLGLTTKDEDFSEVWLTRDQFGSTFIDQLGLTDKNGLLELSMGLSKIGAKIFKIRGGLNFRTSKSQAVHQLSLRLQLHSLLLSFYLKNSAKKIKNSEISSRGYHRADAEQQIYEVMHSNC